MSENKFTPGPYTLKQEDAWPFYVDIVSANGDVILRQDRAAYSSSQKNLAECLDGVGFKGEEREAVIKAIEEQIATMRLFATAPDLLEALIEAVEDLEMLHSMRGCEYEGSIEDLTGEYRAAISKATEG